LLFHSSAGGEEVVGEEAKGLVVVSALVLDCFCYTGNLLTAKVELEIEIAMRIATSLTVTLWLDIV
jgi:hypothetical protein